MRRIILSLFATGLLAACPGDSGVPPPSPTTPLAGEATPTGGGGSGLSTLSLGDPKILTVVKEQFIQTFGDDSCSVPAGADEVSDQWLRVGSGLQCRQIAWTIGNSGGSCEAGCKDWPDPTTEGEGEGATTEETPTTEVPPPPVEDLPVEDLPVEDTPMEDTPMEDTPMEDLPPVDSCTASFATYTQSTNEAIQAATCDSLTLCKWDAGKCVTCQSKLIDGVGTCLDKQVPEIVPGTVSGTVPETNRCENPDDENLYNPPGGFVAGVWRDHDSVCTKRVRGGKCEALYWVGVVGASSVEACSVLPSWCSVLDRGDIGQCKR